MNTKLGRALTKRLDKPKCCRCHRLLNADWDDLGLTPLCPTCRNRMRREFQRAHPRADRPTLDVAVALFEGIDEEWLMDSMIEQGASPKAALTYLTKAKPIAKVGNRLIGKAEMIGGGIAFIFGVVIYFLFNPLLAKATGFIVVPYGAIFGGIFFFLVGLVKMMTGLRKI